MCFHYKGRLFEKSHFINGRLWANCRRKILLSSSFLLVATFLIRLRILFGKYDGLFVYSSSLRANKGMCSRGIMAVKRMQKLYVLLSFDPIFSREDGVLGNDKWLFIAIN